MNLRLIAAVAVAAVLSSGLSVGVSQLSAASPAPATPRSAAAAPTDSELLAEIADNTATANGKLHVLGQDLQSVLSEEKKVYSINYLGAKRLRFINDNLIALYKHFKSVFSYRDPYKTHYNVNELTLLEQSLCNIEFWAKDEATGTGAHQGPPCVHS